MSFFSSRKDDRRSADGEPEAHDRQVPDEQTRLLPPSRDVEAPRYLDASDPAVSPYNLFTVRATRYFTIFLTLITFMWWIVTLVCLFVTPPGMHTRGSGFFAFSYASIALANLIITLLFFSAPSRSIRVLAGFSAVLLLANTIIIAAVQKTRHEELWVGIVTVIWAFLMAVWTIVADRTVQWGKQEEEERLTGRPETRRTAFEWFEVTFASLGLLILGAASFLITCNLIIRALDASEVYPGHRYWVDDSKYQIHVYCTGAKSTVPLPTVLFEAGEDPVENELWKFADRAIANGSITRYCFADRPGMAWSDTAPSPLSAGQATEALSEALARAGEVGPWVLVSAGIGSIYSRIFSSRHGSEVHGLLLVDPLHEDLLYQVASAERGFFLWVRGVLSPLGLDRISGAIFRGRNKADRIWGRSSYQSGKAIFAKLQESLVADSLTKRDVIASRAIQYQDTPLTVISSGKTTTPGSEWESKQKDMTKITTNLRHWDIVDGAPHQVWRTLEGRELLEKRLKALVHARRRPPIGGPGWDDEVVNER